VIAILVSRRKIATASGRARDSGGQTGMRAEREAKASRRRRRGIKATPNTSSTSRRSIGAAKRRAERSIYVYRIYTFEVIGKRPSVSKARAARDIGGELEGQADQATAQGPRHALDGQIQQGQNARGWFNAASRAIFLGRYNEKADTGGRRDMFGVHL
jgi:hypothetical protein